MRSRLHLLLALALVSACGKKIGDACQLPSDCDPDGNRLCELNSPDGYCTIRGCDFGTCPSEAVCVRFYPGLDNAPPCATQSACAFDEICTVANVCASRANEVRFCMLKCSGDGDCRDGYECRTLALMKAHGGEPVPDPNAATAAPPDVPFCAQRRPCTAVTQCEVTEACNGVACYPRPSCSSNANCNPSPLVEICNTRIGQCVRPCAANLDCAANEVCNVANHLCDPI
ncbi:MAG TPA: hypothetical protein VKE22_24475 [Haliangiales bacterium]|nr:hypothetical protein [Haliangiales bacterium]